jgi:hypothetical protein
LLPTLPTSSGWEEYAEIDDIEYEHMIDIALSHGPDPEYVYENYIISFGFCIDPMGSIDGCDWTRYNKHNNEYDDEEYLGG